MGWNDTTIKESAGLFKDMSDPTFYYLHSYMLNLDNSEKNIITSTCNYGDVVIPASIQKDNIFGVQFHPERLIDEHPEFLRIFRAFVKACRA